MLSDIDKAILSDWIKNPAIEIAAVLKKPTCDIVNWLETLYDKMHDIYIDLGSTYFVFCLAPLQSGSVELCSNSINDLCKSGIYACNIDMQYTITPNLQLRSADEIEFGQYCHDNNVVAIYLNGEMLAVYIEGRIKYRINVAHTQAHSVPRFSHGSRGCRDYHILVDDHSKWELVNRMDIIWKDKAGRIFRGGETEKMLQHELFDFLQRYLNDGQPSMENRTNAGDRTDIDVRSAFTGKHYVLEIKWLGKNEGGTEYDYDRIVMGLGQIKTYIERDTSIEEACLVCYDGRSEAIHNQQSLVETGKIPVRGRYKIVFVESESASKKGERYAHRS